MLRPSLPHMLFVCLQWNVIKLYVWLTRRSCATCTAVIRTGPASSCFTPCLEKGNMRRRGMINGLLSGWLHSAFISVFFWKQPAYLLEKKGLWYSKAFSVSQAHIPNGVPGRNEKRLLSVWWDRGPQLRMQAPQRGKDVYVSATAGCLLFRLLMFWQFCLTALRHSK